MPSTQGGQTKTYKTIVSGYNNLFRVSKHVCIYYYNEQGLEQQNRLLTLHENTQKKLMFANTWDL